MKIVRGRADARLMPARYNLALFRLAAYLRLRRAKPEFRDVLFVLDRYQSNFETWSFACWVILTSACYLAALQFGSWPPALAIPVAALLVFLALQVLVVASGLVIPPLWRALTRLQTPGVTVNSFAIMSMVTAASAYCATEPSWARFVAWHFFAMFALNAAAAAIVFLLRGDIERREATIRGDGSAR